MRFWTRAVLPSIFIVLFVINSVASSTELEAGADTNSIEYRNKMILFGGITQGGADHGASIGLEYEYRINALFGAGAFGEYAGGDFDSWVIGVPVFVHPYAGWFILLAPGVEFEDSETSILLRTGVGYEFEFLPRWALAPEFNVDLIEGGETKTVYGVSLSFEF